MGHPLHTVHDGAGEVIGGVHPGVGEKARTFDTHGGLTHRDVGAQKNSAPYL